MADDSWQGCAARVAQPCALGNNKDVLSPFHANSRDAGD